MTTPTKKTSKGGSPSKTARRRGRTGHADIPGHVLIGVDPGWFEGGEDLRLQPASNRYTAGTVVAKRVPKITPSPGFKILELPTDVVIDSSGNFTPIQGIDKAMSLSEEQRAAAKAERYIPPSRVGKRALAGYFSDEVLAELKALAAIRQCTGQSLLDEALTDLFKKHEEVLKVVRQALHTRKP